jgi:hypothetical protein
MTDDKREKRLKLDMEFSEALERIAKTDPDELPPNVKLRRSKKKEEAEAKKASAGKSDPKGKGRGDR